MELLIVLMEPRNHPGNLPPVVGMVNRRPVAGRALPWFTAWTDGRHATVVDDTTAADADATLLSGFRFRRSAGWDLSGRPFAVDVPGPAEPALLDRWITAVVVPAITPTLGVRLFQPFPGQGVPGYRKHMETAGTVSGKYGKRV